MRTFIVRRVLASLAVIGVGLLASPLHAQTGPWTKQATIPSAESIFAVAPRSANEIWCSSAPWPFSHNGHIAHTADAGLNWEITELDVGGVLCITFIDDQYGWTAGGAFRHTTDGGQTWIKDNDWGAIADLFFIDRQYGWACGAGGGAYYTTNGGLDWTGFATGFDNLSSIWFTDRSSGWAVGPSGQIIQSNDGGLSWTLNADTGVYLRMIQFFDPLEGWAVGGNSALHTTDGGVTWNPTPMPASVWAQDARFFDAQHGIAVGEVGQIVRTIDGGETWSVVREAGMGPRLWDVQYGDPDTVVCSGDAGVLLRSTDGGASWNTIQSGAWGITRGIDVHDENLAWAACQGGEIVRTTNGGRLWERHVVEGFGAYGSLWDIDFVDESVGWAVGRVRNSSYYDGRISRSINGGRTWQFQLNVSFAEYMGVVAFDTQTAIAFGWAPMVRTVDGGATWFAAGPPEGVYRGGDAIDATTAWIAGTHIYKTDDAGTGWTRQWESPTGAHLAAISFCDSQNGWAAGFQNQLLHTTDSGQTWVSQNAGAPAGTGFMGVWAIDPNTAWIAGWNGFVARTTDGGATWESETIPETPNAYFECVEFLDADRGWVAGDYGIYFRDPGTNWIEACGPGAVNAGCGLVESVFTVNGSDGGPDLTLTVATDTPITFNVAEAPAMGGDGNDGACVFYIWNTEPFSSDVVELPRQLGNMCFGPFRIATRLADLTFNSIGAPAKLGVHDAPVPPPIIPDGGSLDFYSLPGGIGIPMKVTVQGLVQDVCTQGTKPYSVTNGLVIDVQP